MIDYLIQLTEDQLRLLDDVPNSAVDLQVKDKVKTFFLFIIKMLLILFFLFLKLIKKLNRQDRVVEEVKLVLKPHYNKKHITKEEYKDVLRRSVPKVCFVFADLTIWFQEDLNDKFSSF